MYGNTQDPGNWSLFLKRKDIKDLPLMEAKRKYLKEQLEYESFINMQLARLEMNRQALLVQGGAGNPDSFEDITSWMWNNAGQLDVSDGFTSTIQFEFQSDIDFVNAGTDLVHVLVPNGQQGNGTAATVPYTASNVIEADNVVQFTYIQAPSANGTGVIGANVLALSTELFGSITASPTTPVEGTYTTVAGTWATGTGGVGGQNVQATIQVSALQTVTSIVITANGSGVFQPGNTLTFAGSDLGGGGSLVVTLQEADITGDVVGYTAGTSGTIVVPGSARLFNPNNESVTIDLSFAASQVFGVSGSAITVTA